MYIPLPDILHALENCFGSMSQARVETIARAEWVVWEYEKAFLLIRRPLSKQSQVTIVRKKRRDTRLPDTLQEYVRYFVFCLHRAWKDGIVNGYSLKLEVIQGLIKALGFNPAKLDQGLVRAIHGFVTWTILPEGTKDLQLPTVRRSGRGKARPKYFDRILFLRALGPKAIYRGLVLPKVGADGILRPQREYLAFEYEHVVMVDCIHYGNAIYWDVRDGWQEKFACDKDGARAMGAKKIVHAGDWRNRVRQVLQD